MQKTQSRSCRRQEDASFVFEKLLYQSRREQQLTGVLHSMHLLLEGWSLSPETEDIPLEAAEENDDIPLVLATEVEE